MQTNTRLPQLTSAWTTVVVGALAFALTSIADSRDADAFEIGPQIGFETRGDNVFIGANARFPLVSLGPVASLELGPSIDYYLVDSATILRFGADAQFFFTVHPVVEPYAAAGIGMTYASVKFGDTRVSDTDFGLNIGGGARFLVGPVRPFVGLRGFISGGTAFAVLGGVNFSL